MNYAFEPLEENIQLHLDIEKDIQKQKDGVFTFTIKLANNKAIDYMVVEYVDSRDYLQLKRVIVEELTTTSDYPRGVQKDTVRYSDV